MESSCSPARHHSLKNYAAAQERVMTLTLLSPSSGDNLVSKSIHSYASPQSLRCSGCCLFFRRLLCQKETTTCGKELECSEFIERGHALKRILDGRRDRTVNLTSHRLALIGKTTKAVVTENEMVDQPDAQQVSSFTQPCGERPILRARRGIAGGMIVLCGAPHKLRSSR